MYRVWPNNKHPRMAGGLQKKRAKRCRKTNEATKIDRCRLFELPTELLLHIFSFLDNTSKLQFADSSPFLEKLSGDLEIAATEATVELCTRERRGAADEFSIHRPGNVKMCVHRRFKPFLELPQISLQFHLANLVLKNVHFRKGTLRRILEGIVVNLEYLELDSCTGDVFHPSPEQLVPEDGIRYSSIHLKNMNVHLDDVRETLLPDERVTQYTFYVVLTDCKVTEKDHEQNGVLFITYDGRSHPSDVGRYFNLTAVSSVWKETERLKVRPYKAGGRDTVCMHRVNLISFQAAVDHFAESSNETSLELSFDSCLEERFGMLAGMRLVCWESLTTLFLIDSVAEEDFLGVVMSHHTNINSITLKSCCGDPFGEVDTHPNTALRQLNLIDMVVDEAGMVKFMTPIVDVVRLNLEMCVFDERLFAKLLHEASGYGWFDCEYVREPGMLEPVEMFLETVKETDLLCKKN